MGYASLYKRLIVKRIFILLAQSNVAFLQHDVESGGGGGSSSYRGCGDGILEQLSALSTCVKERNKV